MFNYQYYGAARHIFFPSASLFRYGTIAQYYGAVRFNFHTICLFRSYGVCFWNTFPLLEVWLLFDCFQALEDHFLRHFQIRLDTMALARVGTYAAFISSEGRVKVCVFVLFLLFPLLIPRLVHVCPFFLVPVYPSLLVHVLLSFFPLFVAL